MGLTAGQPARRRWGYKMSITIGAYRTALTDCGFDADQEEIGEYAGWAQLALDTDTPIDELLDAPLTAGHREKAMALVADIPEYEASPTDLGARINGVFYREPTGRDAMRLSKAAGNNNFAALINAIGAMCELDDAGYAAQPFGAFVEAVSWAGEVRAASVTPTA